MTAVPTLVLGASGYIGRQLAALERFEGATWAGRRTDCPLPGYVSVPGYDEASLSSMVRRHDVIVHLAALTRGRRASAMHEANVHTARRLVETIGRHRPDARVMVLSSDLASHGHSPYGRSKRDAEGVLMASGLDVVALRAPAVAGYPLPGAESSLQKLKAMSARAVVPAPNGGRFVMRPLWIEDLAMVFERLIDRRGRKEDRGVWSMFGQPVAYDSLIRHFAGQAGRTPRIVSIPLPVLVAAGRLLARLKPDTTFPLDFLEVIGRDVTHPPDMLEHLGLAPTAPSDYLPRV